MNWSSHSVSPAENCSQKNSVAEGDVDGCIGEDGVVDEEVAKAQGDAEEEDVKCEPCGVEEGVLPPIVRSPRVPSARERASHNATHIPFQFSHGAHPV